MNNSWIKNNKIRPPAPLGWELIRLRDVTQIQGGFAFLSSDFTTSGVPVVRMSDFKQGMLDLSEAARVSDQTVCQLSQFMLEKGDLIIGMSGSITNYAIVDKQNLPAYLNQRVGRLILKDKDRANYNYLTHVLRSPFYESWAYKEATGVAQLNISSQQIEAMYFFLPPLPEQRRIAEILDTIDEAIQKTETLISKLKAMKQGLLHDLLTRGLDKNDKLRDPKAHPELFKDSPLGRIPKWWSVVSIGEIASHVGSGLTPRGGSEVYKTSGVMFIRSQNVTFEGLKLEDIAFIDSKTHEKMRRSEVFANDILLNITGASIGRCCHLPEGLGPTNVNQHVCAIRLPVPRGEDAFYLSSVLASHIGQHQIEVLNAGGNREGLNYQQFRSFVIPWPEKDERTKVANIIAAHDARIRTEEQYRYKLKLQKKGLMHDLLTGKIRVEM